MKGFIRYILKENLPKKGILIKEGVEISKGLKYHKEYDLPLVENVFLPFSDEFFSLINETRGLWKNGLVQLCEDDEWLLKTDIGKTAMFEGDEVWLDIPFLIEEDDESINEAEYKGKKVNLNSPFKISGKLNGRLRATSTVFEAGLKVPSQRLSARVEYSFLEAFTYTGVFGIKVWTYLGTEKK